METSNSSNFWNRPEGTTAKLILGALGLVLAGATYIFLLPFILSVVWGTVQLAIGAGILAALWFAFNSERVHSLAFFAVSSISRAITSLFVNIDPVGILKDFVKDLQNKRKTVTEAIKSMTTVRQKATGLYKTAEKEMNQFLELADVCTDEIQLEGLKTKIGRRQITMKSAQENIAFATETIDALTRIDGVIGYHIDNAEDEMKQLASDNEMALLTLSATHAANSALGDNDKLEIRNMAADVIRDRVAKATGEVENLITTTRSIQGEIDLNKLALSAAGGKKLQELRAQIKSVEVQQGTVVRAIGSGAAQPVQGTNKWAARINRNQQ